MALVGIESCSFGVMHVRRWSMAVLRVVRSIDETHSMSLCTDYGV